MRPEGYQMIVEALEVCEPPVNVTPVPQEGEDIVYLDVSVPKGLSATAVFNALHEAKILADSPDPEGLGGDGLPQLEYVTTVRNSLTFRDNQAL
ncbi:MAG: hypothetical protein QG553_600 [Patescibacteria group bacterium]|nr:hypothetical protein [Patescibacteria group bacterium]